MPERSGGGLRVSVIAEAADAHLRDEMISEHRFSTPADLAAFIAEKLPELLNLQQEHDPWGELVLRVKGTRS